MGKREATEMLRVRPEVKEQLRELSWVIAREERRSRVSLGDVVADLVTRERTRREREQQR